MALGQRAVNGVVVEFAGELRQRLARPREAVALQLGFSDDSFQAALKNQDFFNAIETMRDQALNDFGLEGTPTFYVNGKQLTGEKTMDQLDIEITPLL